MEWTFGNPAFDAAYDRWRTKGPNDDYFGDEDEDEPETESEEEYD